jgi:hypothetical protein
MSTVGLHITTEPADAKPVSVARTARPEGVTPQPPD